MSFIFGGNTGMTPEQVARRRQVADAMFSRNLTHGRVRNNMDLANLAGYNIAGLVDDWRADRDEKAGREGADEAMQSIIKAMGGGGAPVDGGGFVADKGPSQQPAGTTPPFNPDVSQAPDWLRYANEGATRNQPISPDLAKALGFLPEMGLSMEVFSGGQPAEGGGPRVGSTRHDHGNATDAFFYKDGQKLDWRNPEHLPILQEVVRRGKENGITGFGAGERYMQPGSMHVGFGDPAVWGAGGKGTNAPDWLRYANEGAAPAPDGRQAVMAAMGGGGAQPQAQPAQVQPGGRQQVTQAMLPQLMEAMSNPYLNDGQRAVVQAMMAQAMQGAQGMTPYQEAQIGLQRDRLGLEQQRFERAGQAPQGDPFTLGPGQVRFGPDGQQIAAGPEKAASGGDAFTLSPGQQRFGPDGQPIASVDPKLDPKAAAAEAAAPRIEAQAYGKAQNVLTSIDDAISQIGVTKDGKLDTSPLNISGTGFYGSATGWIGGTDAYNLNRTIETIKANLGFDELQRMRAASPTGGALGSITEKELALLQSTVASLDTGQDREALFANLRRVQSIYQKIVQNIEASRSNRTGAAASGMSTDDLFGDFK